VHFSAVTPALQPSNTILSFQTLGSQVLSTQLRTSWMENVTRHVDSNCNNAC
jgi:hypothetical protein